MGEALERSRKVIAYCAPKEAREPVTVPHTPMFWGDVVQGAVAFWVATMSMAVVALLLIPLVRFLNSWIWAFAMSGHVLVFGLAIRLLLRKRPGYLCGYFLMATFVGVMLLAIWWWW